MDAFFTSKFSCDPVEVVFFDVAGTLVKTVTPVGEVYARVAEQHGIELDPKDAEARFRQAFQELGRPNYSLPDGEKVWWRELVETVFGAAVTDVCFEELFNFYAKPQAWEAFPEVFAVLEALQKKVRLGVISNFDARVLPVLDGLELAPFFEEVVYSGEVGSAKPEARIFEVACERMKVAPERCVLVGDDPERDLAGAKAAGMRCVLVDRKRGVRLSDFG